ncbi:RES family NAD+ phosphorylase [Pseudomonas cichorii]|uniref:RES family NAD+ phosphorylase n=1 Tax=Pseudomonas cichorii TaxID=36746 RepID=UPI0018E5B5E3|nr:RES family NAD+ phosphorylase [Pseudomonas cichorii]MBI6851573.1 RES family NAD+ phosphorylase [Pseudomonas cichorii]
MEAWRVTTPAFATDLSGQGAALYGGRWNHREHKALYFGMSAAICALEAVIHCTEVPRIALKLVRVKLPDEPQLYCEPDLQPLGESWASHPADIQSMDFGTAWLTHSQQLGLIVPSSALPQARNILLNPRHPAAKRIEILEITDFALNQRLISTTSLPRT